MRFLQSLKWKLERYHIRNLMMYLCLGMAGVFVLDVLFGSGASGLLRFDKTKILHGQIWRLVTFLIVPPSGGLISVALHLYFYYFLGSLLEQQWSSASFNLYYLLGFIGCVVSGLLFGGATNEFLNLSLVLAFALSYPEQQFLLFFIVPVKARWFGILTGVMLIWEVLTCSWTIKPCILFSLIPFVIFFGQTAWTQVKLDIRRVKNLINGRRY